MKSLFISPHNDDIVLFSSFNLLKEASADTISRPHVIEVLRSDKQDSLGITYSEREQESRLALNYLGATVAQWPFLDTNPDWVKIEDHLEKVNREDTERIYYPAFTHDGNKQHNIIASICSRIFDPNKSTQYLTYSVHGKTTRTVVKYERWMLAKKLRALSFYISQINEPSTHEHFIREQREYIL